jgi:tripartite-type tricarboxylate transporter receptor subunit TctC
MRQALRRICLLLTALATVSSASQAVLAQSWPQRLVKFIVPLGPGAGIDINARLLADQLSVRWGKPVVIENHPGGDGILAINTLLSIHDDHTLLYAAPGSFTVHPYTYRRLPYNPDDLVPIARASNTAIAVAVFKSLPVDSLGQFVQYAKEHPGKLNSAVVPGITDFVFSYFVKTAGLNIAKVPYRDIVQAANDVGQGRIQVMMASLAILRPQLDIANIKLLAVTNGERIAIAPGVPTATELGYSDLELDGLAGLFGAPGIPDPLRDSIARDVSAVIADPAIAQKLSAAGQMPNPGKPADFAAAIDAQRTKVALIAKALDIKPEN